tara:strand:+ start:5718 stop:6152 length:435 start_codon:yes stop_codon:yes gene_type:complete
MISFKVSCENNVKKYETNLALFSNLTDIYTIHDNDNNEIGCFGYIKTTQLNVDRIIGLVVSVDKNHQNKGYFKLIGDSIKEMLINDSDNGKIWILTQLLNIKSRMFARYFGMVKIKNKFYLYHNTDNDKQALLFANLLIDKLTT